MKIYPTKIIKLISTTFVLFLFFSCAKDSDLLADIIIEEAIITETTIDADNASITVDEDKAVSFNMLNNTASKGGSRKYKSSKQPKNGGLVIEKDSIAIYTPDYDYNGTDTIEITLEETNVDNSTSEVIMTVEATVNPTEDVVDDKVETIEGVTIVIEPLKNDTFNADSGVIITETSVPSKGNVILNDDNTLLYTPNPGVVGIDLFTYTTQIINIDESVTTESGSITVTIGTPETSGVTDYGELKAFPKADGFGKYTTGGRGGRIVHVTNLNDTGAGSLRSALNSTGPRTIVFDVSGTIECNSYLSIPTNSGDVTIAGQTAPGEGITIKGAELRIQASNVIVRYLRIRPGDSTSGSNEDGVRVIAYSGNRTENVIIDHCSISWGKDENVEIGGIGTGSSVRNVTIQNSIIAENIKTQYGLLLWNDAKNISINKNLFAHNKERNIRSSTCTSDFEMVNNVIYGYRSATNPTYENKFDIIGNVYITNPSVAVPNETLRLEASLNNCPDGKIGETRAYLKDNILDGKAITVQSIINSYLETGKIFNSNASILPSSQVKDLLLSDVGASLVRDAIDSRIISDVKNRVGGLKTSSASAGGYPIVNFVSRDNNYDSDKDGMADAWELANGLDPNNPDDSNKDSNGDGYTNLEDFLNQVDF